MPCTPLPGCLQHMPLCQRLVGLQRTKPEAGQPPPTPPLVPKTPKRERTLISNQSHWHIRSLICLPAASCRAAAANSRSMCSSASQWPLRISLRVTRPLGAIPALGGRYIRMHEGVGRLNASQWPLWTSVRVTSPPRGRAFTCREIMTRESRNEGTSGISYPPGEVPRVEIPECKRRSFCTSNAWGKNQGGVQLDCAPRGSNA